MRHTPPKPICWLLVLLLLFEWSGVLGWRLVEAQSSKQIRLTLPSPAELAKVGASLPPAPQRVSLTPEALVSQTEALSKAVPRVRYDLATRAEALGPGVDPAFRFVRDQIRFEAYTGVLRGSEGTYVTRAGNALDRSLLLADLLKRKNVKARFAMGKLPRPQAERLYARIFEPAPALEAEATSKAATFDQTEGAAFTARLRARAVRDYAAIRKALGNALPAKPSPSREEVLREIEGHVWVQAEVNGRWVDLDSAFPDAPPGPTYAAAERTVEALPKGSYQRVTIRVTSETLSGNSLKTETALEFSATAEEVLDRQIFVAHAPGGGGGGLEGAISGAVAGANAWTPMLWVDGQFHIGKPISFADQKPAERGRAPGGGLGGLFGAGGALSASSQFVAEWLEFETALSDGRREVTRQALVDRAGMAWRQAGKLDAGGLRPLVRDADGLTAPRVLHNIWFSAGRHNLQGYANALRYLAQWIRVNSQPDPSGPQGAGATKEPAPSLTFGQQVWPLAMLNFAFLVRSDHAILPALNDSPSYRFYPDSPRILIVSVGLDSRPGGTVDGYVQYDLRRDHLRGLAREAADEAGVVERKVWFGLLQGALEHETVVQYTSASDGDESAVTSTSRLLTGEGAIAFRPGVAANKLATNRETAARMAHALADKVILVVPRPVLRGGVSGWWEIDANGADTRAVLGYDTNAARGGLKPGWVRKPYGGVGPSVPNMSGPMEQIGPQRPGPGGPQPNPDYNPRPGGGVTPRDPPVSEGRFHPGGTKDDCKKGSSLPTQGIRVAMASPLPSGLLDGHARESVETPLLLAQTSTEYTLVTKCVAVPAVGVAGIAMAIVALGFLGVAAAALGYLIGSAL